MVWTPPPPVPLPSTKDTLHTYTKTVRKYFNDYYGTTLSNHLNKAVGTNFKHWDIKEDGSGNLVWSSTLPGGSKTKTTPEGGFAVYMYNGSGSTIDQYMVVMADPYHDSSIAIAPAYCVLPIGVSYETITSGSWGWIVISGIAAVQINSSVTRSYYAYVSGSVAGKVDDDNDPASSHHYREIGHFLESKTVNCSSGSTTPIIAKVILHFN